MCWGTEFRLSGLVLLPVSYLSRQTHTHPPVCTFELVFCLHVCLCEGVGSPGSGVTDSSEVPCGCWKLNQGSLLLISKPSPCLFVCLFVFLLITEDSAPSCSKMMNCLMWLEQNGNDKLHALFTPFHLHYRLGFSKTGFLCVTAWLF